MREGSSLEAQCFGAGAVCSLEVPQNNPRALTCQGREVVEGAHVNTNEVSLCQTIMRITRQRLTGPSSLLWYDSPEPASLSDEKSPLPVHRTPEFVVIINITSLVDSGV
jgi:hypothetical protein